jgi:hypothetical protein
VRLTILAILAWRPIPSARSRSLGAAADLVGAGRACEGYLVGEPEPQVVTVNGTLASQAD